MINKYKFTDTQTEFLCYSDNEIKFPEDIPVELIEENVDPSKHGDTPILHFESLLIRGLYQKARTRDKILEENNCLTFNQLSASYFLIKTKQLNKPRSVREAIEKKYDDIIQYINPPGNIVSSDESLGEQESSS